MKRVIYISLVFVGLLGVSCSKQNIQPNPNPQQEAPTWRTSSSDENGGGDTSTTGDGGITDPNNDKDENGRRRN